MGHPGVPRALFQSMRYARLSPLSVRHCDVLPRNWRVVPQRQPKRDSGLAFFAFLCDEGYVARRDLGPQKAFELIFLEPQILRVFGTPRQL